MSFRDDYRSAFDIISPDAEKIAENVREMLDENAPIKLRTRKKPVWVWAASFVGAAVCAVFCIIFIPGFFGLSLIDTDKMNNAGEMNGAGNSPENFGTNGYQNEGSDISLDSGSQVTPETDNPWYSAEFFVRTSSDGNLIEVVKDGESYFKTGTIKADEVKGKYTLVIHVDGADFGNTYYVKFRENEDIIYVAEENSEWAYVFEKMSAYVNGKDLSNIDIMLITNENKETRVILEDDSYIKTGESFYLKTLPDSAACFSSGGIKYLICGNEHRVMVVDTDTYLAQYYTKENKEVLQSEVIINESITVTQ